MRLILVVLFSLFLSGCFFESSTTALPPVRDETLMPDNPELLKGITLYVNSQYAAVNDLIKIRKIKGEDRLVITGKKNGSENFLPIHTARIFPAMDGSFLIAEYKAGSKFAYYGLHEEEYGFSVTSAQKKVSNWFDLTNKIKKQYDEIGPHTVISYEPLSKTKATALLENKERKLKKTAEAIKKLEQLAKKKSQNQASQSKARTSSVLDDFDAGDTLYLSGLFSDTPVTIVRIDREQNRVKVSRHDDGTTQWVNPSDLVDRNGRTANNIGRAGLAAGAILCLATDACKKK